MCSPNSFTHLDGLLCARGNIRSWRAKQAFRPRAMSSEITRRYNDIAVPSFISSGAPFVMYIPKSCGATSCSDPHCGRSLVVALFFADYVGGHVTSSIQEIMVSIEGGRSGAGDGTVRLCRK